MNLAAELKGAQQAKELSYTLLFPPGWAHFGITREAEAQLVKNVRDIYQDGGRPEIALDMRTRIHVYFSRLRSIGASAVYLPIRRVDDIVLPVSIAAVPYSVAPGNTVLDLASSLGAGAFEEVHIAQGPVLRSVAERNRVEKEDGLSSRTITYLVPAPGDRPRKAVVFSFAILHLTGEEGSEFVEVLDLLFTSIIGTFRWRQE
jgi:hypothetical protein